MRMKNCAVQLACLLLLLTGSGLAQAITSGVPVLQDGNGQIVGPVIDRGANQGGLFITEHVDTVIYIDGLPYFLRASAGSSRLSHPGEARFGVFFKDSSCSGTPYIASTLTFFPSVFNIYAVVNDVVTQELSIYRPQSGATLMANQSLDYSLNVDGVCTDQNPVGGTAILAEKVTIPIVAPFSIRQSSSLTFAAFPFGIPALNSPGQWLLLAALVITGWFASRRRGSADRSA